MHTARKYVISIAGLDPSGGAGILADIKTFESLEVYGLGVCSAITFQTEDEFVGVSWIPLHQIELQFDLLMKKYPVEFVKIGLIQSLEALDELVQFVKKNYPEVKIVWDPILKASAGFQFHQTVEEELLHEILSKIFLVTPNCEEAKAMMHEEDAFSSAKAMNRFCNVYLKSWKNKEENHFDILFEAGQEFYIGTDWLEGFSKHGSGCVLSAAITGNLAKGFSLKTSCENGKEYTHEFLKSSEGILGIHHKIYLPQHA